MNARLRVPWSVFLLFSACGGTSSLGSGSEVPTEDGRFSESTRGDDELREMPSSAESSAPPRADSVRTGRDPRAIGLLTVSIAYRNGERRVWEDHPGYHTPVRDCFELAFPHDRRAEGEYRFRIAVENRNFDSERGFRLGFRDDYALSYPRPGTYPEFEACVRRAVPSVAAPDSVQSVDLIIHVLTESHAINVVGHGS